MYAGNNFLIMFVRRSRRTKMARIKTDGAPVRILDPIRVFVAALVIDGDRALAPEIVLLTESEYYSIYFAFSSISNFNLSI